MGVVQQAAVNVTSKKAYATNLALRADCKLSLEVPINSRTSDDFLARSFCLFPILYNFYMRVCSIYYL